MQSAIIECYINSIPKVTKICISSTLKVSNFALLYQTQQIVYKTYERQEAAAFAKSRNQYQIKYQKLEARSPIGYYHTITLQPPFTYLCDSSV